MKGEVIIKNVPANKGHSFKPYIAKRFSFDSTEDMVNLIYRIRIDHDLSAKEIVLKFEDEIHFKKVER